MKMLKVFMLLICLVLLSGLVHAASIPVSVDEVTINGVQIDPSAPNRLDLQIGQNIDVRVKLEANADAKNLQIEAFISGYEYSDFEPISDSTHVFDVQDGVVYIKHLKLSLPEKVQKDSYKLRLIVSDRYSDLKELNYNLLIDRPRHSVKITDVWFTPENKVMAGEYLISSVRLKNYGNKDESGLKVIVSIPELDLSAVDYVDELKAGDSVSSEELYLRIPRCNVKPGEYEVDAKVVYDNGYELNRYKTHILIGNEGSCNANTTVPPKKTGGKLVIALESNTINLEKGGKGAVIPITITNQGTESQAVMVSMPQASWATFRASPSNVIALNGGDTKTVYVYVSANKDAAVGTQSFVLSIKNADGKDLKDLSFTANVKAAAKTTTVSTAWVLEIILIVLIAILVLIGLIIGFKKLMGSEEEAEEEASTETYY